MKLAVVKSKDQYQEYMARIESLVLHDPLPESKEGAELELLSLLVEDYERKSYRFEKPDPVEAVRFRMLEQGLRQTDLVPYFGTRSRVSEFLSRQRPLTVGMIRQLSIGLGIPADVLVQDSTADVSNDEAQEDELDWAKFPIKEMIKKGWIQIEKNRLDSAKAIDIVRAYVEKAMGGARMGVFARRTIKGDAFTPDAIYSLRAWQARVLQRSVEPQYCANGKFKLENLNEYFFKELISLSPLDDGPVRAVNFLRDAGIAVVIEEHLSKTKLDGAAMLSGSGVPVIGLTLRFDRIDNFWFTLLHECAHVWKHLNRPGDVILDRLVDAEGTDAVEKEANRIARDSFISRSHWRSASVRQYPTKEGIVKFAQEQGIHPAIVAGRIQRETENYTRFKDMIGQGLVKPLFDVIH